MSFTWNIARRYLWSKRRHPFVGVVSTISMLGIFVGVSALITVLAVMNGFDQDLKSRIIGTRAHLVVEKNGLFDEPAAVGECLKKLPETRGVSPYVEGQALLQVGEWGTGVLVRGIDPDGEKKVSSFFEYLSEGTLNRETGGIVIGSELAKRARLSPGSEISIATQNTEKPRVFRVDGIFSSGMYEFDSNLAFLNLPDAQSLFGMQGLVSGLSVRWESAERADKGKRALQEALGYPYLVLSWMDLNRTLFSALKLEKIVMFLILALIILVACLNIAGSLTILVMDKTKDIGVLKALGAAPVDLVKIFAWDGLALGLSGSLLGLAGGMLLCEALRKYSFFQLPKEIYYIENLPVSMDPGDTALVVVVAVCLSFFSALYPALMAGSLDPVKALRYE